MKRYEYKIIWGDSQDVKDSIKALGESGFRIVQTYILYDTPHFVFERVQIT